jgi:hypothetical protein
MDREKGKFATPFGHSSIRTSQVYRSAQKYHPPIQEDGDNSDWSDEEGSIQKQHPETKRGKPLIEKVAKSTKLMEHYCTKFFKLIDRDDSNSLSLIEFVGFMKTQQKRTRRSSFHGFQSTVIDRFKDIDEDGSGDVELDELIEHVKKEENRDFLNAIVALVDYNERPNDVSSSDYKEQAPPPALPETPNPLSENEQDKESKAEKKSDQKENLLSKYFISSYSGLVEKTQQLIERGERPCEKSVFKLDRAMDDEILRQLTYMVLAKTNGDSQPGKNRRKIQEEDDELSRQSLDSKARSITISPTKGLHLSYAGTNELKADDWRKSLEIKKSKRSERDKKQSRKGKKKPKYLSKRAQANLYRRDVTELSQMLLMLIDRRKKRMTKELAYTIPSAIDRSLLEELAIGQEYNKRRLIQLQRNKDDYYSSENIRKRCIRVMAARTIQKAWRRFLGLLTKVDFHEVVLASSTIARAFKNFASKRRAKRYMNRLKQWRDTQFSDGSDSDTSSSDDEDDGIDIYDSFIARPRKAYAAQSIQSLWRGYNTRQKVSDWYLIIKAAQICIARHWRGEMARERCKRLRKPNFRRLVVEDAIDEESWEFQLERIREEALQTGKSPITYKFTSPEKDRWNRELLRKGKDSRTLYTGLDTVIFQRQQGWVHKKLNSMY